MLDLRQTLGLLHKIGHYFVRFKRVLCPVLKKKLNLRCFFPCLSLEYFQLPMEALELFFGSLNPRCSLGLDLHLLGFPLGEKLYSCCSEKGSVPAGESVACEKAEKGENNYNGLKNRRVERTVNGICIILSHS